MGLLAVLILKIKYHIEIYFRDLQVKFRKCPLSIEALSWKQGRQTANLPDNDHLLVAGKSKLSDVDQCPLIHKQYTHH